MQNTEAAPARGPEVADGATFAAVPLNDAARKALVILAAGTLAAVAATMLCLAAGVHNGRDPADVQVIRNLFPSLRISDFLPEPLERAQAIAFIAGAYSMSIALALLPRLDSMIPPRAARPFWALFASAVFGYLVFGQNAFQYPSRLFGTVKSVWLPEEPVLWIVAFGITASPVLVGSTELRRHATHFLAAIGILVLVLLCARVSLLEPPYGLTLDIQNHHNSAALHSIVQSTFGQIPYVDFVPQYGGYGLFAVPFFRLGVDPWLALSLFLFFCYLVTFGAMATAVALNARSWVAGSYAGIAAFWLCANFQFEYSFFQGIPLRAFFPSIFLLLFSLYARSPALVCAIGGLMVPFAFYWNPETGLVCLVATASFLLFDAIAQSRSGGPTWGQRLWPLLLFSVACALTTAALWTAAALLLERSPTASNFFTHMNVFSRLGFLNLPMPLLDVWVPAAFAFCLLLSFPGHDRAARDEVRSKALFGVYCAMLFSGLFFYYQGYSFTGKLIAFAFPLLCGGFSWLWAGAEPAERVSGFRFPRRNVAILAFAVASAALAGSPFTHTPFLDPTSVTMSDDDQALRAFIRNESRGHRAAMIVSPQAWRLHLLSGVSPPASIPPQSGLHTRFQEQDTLNGLSPSSGYALFVDPRYFSERAHTGTPFPKILKLHIDAQWRRGETLRLNSGELTVFYPKDPSERRTPPAYDNQIEFRR